MEQQHPRARRWTTRRPAADASTTIALRDEFERVFRRLPPDQRAVFVYRHYLGYDLAEIATELEVPLGTVKSRLHYATHALRSAMDADRRAEPAPSPRSDPHDDRPSDFDRYAREWLEDGPVQLADPVLDATLVAVHRTTQQHRQSFGRFTVSFTSPRLIAAAVIVLLVAGGAVGLAVLRSHRERGDRPAIARRLGAARRREPPSRARAPRRAAAVFADPNTYIFAMDPGYASPGTRRARRAGSSSSVPASRTAVKLDIAVDGDLRRPGVVARRQPDRVRLRDARGSPAVDGGVGREQSHQGGDVRGRRAPRSTARPGRPTASSSCSRRRTSRQARRQPTAARIVVLTLAGAHGRWSPRAGPTRCPWMPSWSPRGDALVYDRVAARHDRQADRVPSVWTIGADGTGETR